MLRVLILAFVLCQGVFGYASYSGWCEQGGVKVTVQGLSSPLTFQQSYPNLQQSAGGPSVTVYATGTTTKATLYSDNSGTPLNNPFPCSATGQFLFFTVNSVVDIKFSGTGISTFTRAAIDLLDPASVPTTLNVATACGAIANGTGSAGTDQSTKFQTCIDRLHAAGGGALFIPYAPLCYWAQGIILYSNITIYSDSQSTCVQKPAGNPATITQVFTTANTGGSGAAVSNIHFYNFTIDGNQANQAGISATQEGLYGIYLGGCSNCSVENMRIINHFIDGMQVGGYGATTVAGVMAITNPSTVITGAAWDGSTGLFTFTSAAFTLVTNQETKITGVNPSGYNINCFVVPVDATHFSCTQSNANPGAYVSGGVQTSYLGTWTSGTNFSQFAAGISLFLGAGGCVSGTQTISYNPISATVIGFSIGDPAPNASIAFCSPSYAGVGSGVSIRNNYFAGNRRWGIAHVAGPNTLIEDNYFTANGVVGYGNGGCIDVEPFQLGSLLYGSQYNRNQCYNSYARGINIIPNTQKDPNFAPISMDNTIIGTTAGPGFYAASSNVTTKPLTLSGTFLNNLDQGILTNWEGNTTGTFVAASGSAYGWSVNSGFGGTVNILGGSLNGSSFDVSNANFSTMVVAAGVLVNNTPLGPVRYSASVLAPGMTNGLAYHPGGNTGALLVSDACVTAEPVNPAVSCTSFSNGNTAAGSFIVGARYAIISVGSTNFIAIGAASNTVGIIFVATGVGSGTGTALQRMVAVMQADGNTNDAIVGGSSNTAGRLVGNGADTCGLATDILGRTLTYACFPTYANNAAAIVGGLLNGALYRITGADTLGIVHP